MPVRVFTEDEKITIREKLLSLGFPMLKEYGMVHMSIPKISQAAGIGTGTFYRFFKSKEDYIYQLIGYQRKLLLTQYIPTEVRIGQRKLTREEVRGMIELIVDKDRSVYANLSLSDENKLYDAIENLSPDVEREKAKSSIYFSYIDNLKNEIDFPLVANLMKVLAITSQARVELHPEGYKRTIDVIIDSILEQLIE